jgi:hypothetical protein
MLFNLKQTEDQSMKMILVDTWYDSDENPIGYEYRVLIKDQWYRLYYRTEDIRDQHLKTAPLWNHMPQIGTSYMFTIKPEKPMEEPMGLTKDFLDHFEKTGENSGVFHQPLSKVDVSQWPEYSWGWTSKKVHVV